MALASSHDGMAATARKRFVKKRPRNSRSTSCRKRYQTGSRLHLAKGITLLESITPEDKAAGSATFY